MLEVTDLDLFDQISKADCICITTNCSIDDEGRNPMGGGVAGAARKRWPVIEYVYGNLLTIMPHVPCILGYINKNNTEIFVTPDEVVPDENWCALVAYPTMHSIMENADLNLVCYSAFFLAELADSHEWDNVFLVSPGTGIGGLSVDEVHPALNDILDDRFTIMRKEDKKPVIFQWKSFEN